MDVEGRDREGRRVGRKEWGSGERRRKERMLYERGSVDQRFYIDNLIY